MKLLAHKGVFHGACVCGCHEMRKNLIGIFCNRVIDRQGEGAVNRHLQVHLVEGQRLPVDVAQGREYGKNAKTKALQLGAFAICEDCF